MVKLHKSLFSIKELGIACAGTAAYVMVMVIIWGIFFQGEEDARPATQVAVEGPEKAGAPDDL